MSKKPNLSKVDAEDMVKIILTDAIEAEKANVKKALEKLPKVPSDKSELKKKACDIAKPRGIGRIGYGIKIVVVNPKSEQEIEFNRYYAMPEIRAARMGDDRDSGDLELIVTERQWNDCVALTEHYRNREEQTVAIEARLNELKKKLENYKDLAARFRLGFTGDPTDLNSVNNKCKEYLLQKGK